MTAAVVVGLLVVVLAVFAWSRLSSSRSDKRSMESYGHALDVLGDVARRSDRSAAVRPLSPEETAKPHVLTDVAAPGDSPRADPRTPPTTSISAAGGALSFGEPPAREERAAAFVEDGTAVVPTPQLDAVSAPRSGPAPRPEMAVRESAGSHRRRLVPPARGRAVAAGAAAAVAVLVLALLGLRLVGQSAHRAAAPPVSRASSQEAHTSGPPASSTTSTTRPKTLVPTSSSSSVVAFDLSSASYVLTFADSGTSGCWVGIQANAGGPWLWMTTLSPGQSATYRANGPTVVRLGAPKYVGVQVNGVPAELPGYSLPYDIVFRAGSGPASA